MKSINKHLSTGIVLAIALFASTTTIQSAQRYQGQSATELRRQAQQRLESMRNQPGQASTADQTTQILGQTAIAVARHDEEIKALKETVNGALDQMKNVMEMIQVLNTMVTNNTKSIKTIADAVSGK